MENFRTETVLKRDLFSETRKGFLENAPNVPVIRRIVTASPLWTRPIARLLANREIAALKAVRGIIGTPELLEVDRDGLVRLWSEGEPLHVARPSDPQWYRDAFRLLRELRRAGITHNDLAKPQNWLMTPDGRAAVIDFQLASRHRRRGALFRLMAYEDFRHLIKQMRAFAPELMSPAATRILARRSLPSRVWMATGKRVYNVVTRGIFRWSDGEGTHDRIEREGDAIVGALRSAPGVRDVVLTHYPLPRKGSGIYAFVEIGDAGTSAAELEAAQAGLPGGMCADLVQAVRALPRDRAGRPREDILRRIAMNQVAGIEDLAAGDRIVLAVVSEVAAGRLNFSDRRITSLEKETP